MSEDWTGFVAGPRGRRLTAVLLMLQLGGCVLDVATLQFRTLTALTCTFATGGGPIGPVAVAISLILSFSWIAGLAGLFAAAIRLIYWALIAAIPVAVAVQAWLVHHHVLYCHFHI